MIKKFLPEPDFVQNFKYGCAYFYGQMHVVEIEKTDEFKVLQTKALKRREAGIAATNKRRKEYLEYLENRMPVRVKELPEDELIERACNSYNRLQRDRAWRRYEQGSADNFEISEASSGDDSHFLNRITVNYIRHRLTQYDDLLENTHGKLAKQEAIEIIQRRIFAAISDAYPKYRDECKRQCAARGIELPESINYEFGEQMELFAFS